MDACKLVKWLIFIFKSYNTAKGNSSLINSRTKKLMNFQIESIPKAKMFRLTPNCPIKKISENILQLFMKMREKIVI
jgi:hypothetical protein